MCDCDKNVEIEIKPQVGHIVFQTAMAVLTGGWSLVVTWETERAFIKRCEDIMEQKKNASEPEK